MAAVLVAAGGAVAHPGSGIVVDELGQVFFADLSRGLIEIDSNGNATTVHKEGGHWLALDPRGSFSRVQFAMSDHWPRWFKRRTPDGVAPALITDGGSPLVIGRDGNLYYACDDEQMIPGGLQIGRLSPDGKLTLVNPKLREIGEKLHGIKGLACGPDGALYATYPKAILRIDEHGNATTLVNPVIIRDGRRDGPAGDAPALRGLAVGADNSVFAAATGCGCVIKVATTGQVIIVHKAESPWAPCGVALHRGELFVLEHVNPNSEAHEDWPPGVRRLARNGNVTTLFTAAGASASASERRRPLLVPAPGSPIPAASGGSLIAGKVNGDAFEDLTLVAGKSLKIFFGAANRAWPKEPNGVQELAAGGSETALEDVNHDGRQDIVIADHDTYAVAVLLGDGEGHFKPVQGSPFVAREGTQPHTHGLAVADTNDQMTTATRTS
jgi:hypothetical protein